MMTGRLIDLLYEAATALRRAAAWLDRARARVERRHNRGWWA